MKNICKSIGILLVCQLTLLPDSISQDVNWASLKDQRHIVSLESGLLYGLIVGAGYGYHYNSKIPGVLSITYSFPAGGKILDDLKSTIGGQFDVFHSHHFHTSVTMNGVFRRYQNSLVRMINFGSELGVVAGYYRRRWFLAGEFGFDKAIVTHFKHSAIYEEIFPGVVNGWYEPTTGGNFNYGIQAGLSRNHADLIFKAGQLITQDFKTRPFIPFYVQLGLNLKISKKALPSGE